LLFSYKVLILYTLIVQTLL